MYSAFNSDDYGKRLLSLDNNWRTLYSPSLAGNTSNAEKAVDGLYDVRYTDLISPKVDLENLTVLMPVTTAGYSFQAPDQWGRPWGELQYGWCGSRSVGL